MSKKTCTRSRPRPVEEVFNGVMEELRALRADVERLQTDRVKEQSSGDAASTAIPEPVDNGKEPSMSTGRQGLSNSVPASGSSSEPRECEPLLPLLHDTVRPLTSFDCWRAFPHCCPLTLAVMGLDLASMWDFYGLFYDLGS